MYLRARHAGLLNGMTVIEPDMNTADTMITEDSIISETFRLGALYSRIGAGRLSASEKFRHVYVKDVRSISSGDEISVDSLESLTQEKVCTLVYCGRWYMYV